MRSGQFANGVKDGLWVSYYASGNKQSEGAYLMGQKDELLRTLGFAPEVSASPVAASATTQRN